MVPPLVDFQMHYIELDLLQPTKPYLRPFQGHLGVPPRNKWVVYEPNYSPFVRGQAATGAVFFGDYVPFSFAKKEPSHAHPSRTPWPISSHLTFVIR